MGSCDFKVVLLGSEHVGKISLVIRLVHSTFNAAVPYQSTIGAAFCVKQVTFNNRNYNLGIWDTAGSERYEAMSRLYYRGAHAAILCYTPTDLVSWQRLRRWLVELRRVQEDCKVYLCATKKDILDANPELREVPLDIIETYSRDLAGHYVTSSKTGENVEELFQQIVTDCTSDKKLMDALEERKTAENNVSLNPKMSTYPCTQC